MKKRWTASILTLAMLGTVAFSGCGSANTSGGEADGDGVKAAKLTMQCVGTDQGIDYITSVKFAERVAELSNQAIQITVYGNDQLANGATTKALEMLATGQVDFGSYSQSVLSTICDKIGICSLPWIFGDYADVNEKMQGEAGAYCETALAEAGIKWLDYTHNALRQISNSKREIKTPEDIKNLKIRIPGGQVFSDVWSALGADATAMSWSEVFTALQQGTIDGQDNGFKTSSSNSIQEVNKYFTVWNYIYDGYPLLVNQQSWDKLDEEQQAIIMQAANEVCAWSREWVETEETEIIAAFEAAGCTITYLTEEELLPFKEKVQPVIDKYKDVFGEEAYNAFGIAY